MEALCSQLDFEIQEIIKDLDLEQYYTKNSQETPPSLNLKDLKKDSKMYKLIMLARQKYKAIDELNEAASQARTSEEAKSIVDKIQELSGNKELTPVNKQSPFHPPQETEQERKKKKKERSAGEIALMFMGINQSAFDLLIENPMTGYMDEVVFSRILGQDDIEQGNYWADTSLCYVCQKWNKLDVRFDARTDLSAWTLKITQIGHLRKTIEGLNKQAIEVEKVEREKFLAEKAL